ncbi:hypothetical protein, partial [uncultured Sutterella sp.]|uniref:hypothetical protein n=1 Tax=uncultured Sutterella sp. TaxID=286133 RepID=UPI00259BCAB9
MLDVLVRTPAGKVARRGLPIFRGKNGEAWNFRFAVFFVSGSVRSGYISSHLLRTFAFIPSFDTYMMVWMMVSIPS